MPLAAPCLQQNSPALAGLSAYGFGASVSIIETCRHSSVAGMLPLIEG